MPQIVRAAGEWVFFNIGSIRFLPPPLGNSEVEMCTIFKLDILGEKNPFHLLLPDEKIKIKKNYGNDNHDDVMHVKHQLNNNAQTKAATAIKFYKQHQPALK